MLQILLAHYALAFRRSVHLTSPCIFFISILLDKSVGCSRWLLVGASIFLTPDWCSNQSPPWAMLCTALQSSTYSPIILQLARLGWIANVRKLTSALETITWSPRMSHVDRRVIVRRLISNISARVRQEAGRARVHRKPSIILMYTYSAAARTWLTLLYF